MYKIKKGFVLFILTFSLILPCFASFGLTKKASANESISSKYIKTNDETILVAKRVVQKLADNVVFSLSLECSLEQMYNTALWVSPELSDLGKMEDASRALIKIYEEILAEIYNYNLTDYYSFWKKASQNTNATPVVLPYHIKQVRRLLCMRETIEALLATDSFYELLDEDDLQRIKKEFEVFSNLILSSIENTPKDTQSFILFNQYRSYRESEILNNRSFSFTLNGVTYHNDSTVYTTVGNPVTTYLAESELSNAYIAAFYSNFYGQPGFTDIVKISDATSYYNCHAFAWYSTNPGSKWIGLNYPSSNPVYYGVEQYISDAHCTSLGSSDSVAQVNDIIVYWVNGLPAHSGIVVSTNPLRIESKWGAGCLWIHNKSSVPNSYKESGVVNATYYRYSRFHNYQYSQVSSTKHRALCTVCGHTFLESHYYWNNNNICSLCGYISNRLRNQDEEDCDSCTHSN